MPTLIRLVFCAWITKEGGVHSRPREGRLSREDEAVEILENHWPPFPQIDIIGAVVTVWRARGKIIRSVLCSIVCNNCTQ